MDVQNETGGLAALAAVTRETDEANPSPEQRQAQQQEQEQASAAEQGAREWGQLMFLFGGAVTMVAPELKPCYSEERCMQWGGAANAVAEKYQWNSPAIPELTLAACTLSFVVPTFLVLREKARAVTEAKNAGAFGKLVLWWRARRAAKAGQEPAPAAAEPAKG